MRIVWVVVVLVVVWWVHVYITRGNYTSLRHVLSLSSSKDAVPLDDHFLSLVRANLTSAAGGRLVDFGCGDGRILRSLRDMFVDAHGVEIDADMASRADRMCRTDPKIRIFNQDMLDYTFDMSVRNTLFLYEPLWNCTKQFADVVYDLFFTKNRDKIDTIVYVSGTMRRDVVPERYGFRCVRTFSSGSKWFPKVCRMYSARDSSEPV